MGSLFTWKRRLRAAATRAVLLPVKVGPTAPFYEVVVDGHSGRRFQCQLRPTGDPSTRRLRSSWAADPATISSLDDDIDIDIDVLSTCLHPNPTFAWKSPVRSTAFFWAGWGVASFGSADADSRIRAHGYDHGVVRLKSQGY